MHEVIENEVLAEEARLTAVEPLPSDQVESLHPMPRAQLVAMMEQNLMRQIAFVKSADVKITILFTLMGGYIAASLQAKIGIADKGIPVTSWSFYLASITLAILTMCSLLSATFPDIKFRRGHHVKPTTKNTKETNHIPSVVYFGHIANQSVEGFTDRILDLTVDEYIHDLTSQTFINATIAKRKHTKIQLAVWLASLSLFCFFLYQIPAQITGSNQPDDAVKSSAISGAQMGKT